MSTWQHLAPTGGWDSFAESAVLTAALWAQLPPTDWRYLNLTSDSSVWESRQDASMVQVFSEGERITEFAVQPGAANEVAAPLIVQFQLSPVPPPA